MIAAATKGFTTHQNVSTSGCLSMTCQVDGFFDTLSGATGVHHDETRSGYKNTAVYIFLGSSLQDGSLERPCCCSTTS